MWFQIYDWYISTWIWGCIIMAYKRGGGYHRILKPSLTMFTKFDYLVRRIHDSQKLLWHVVVFHFWRFWPSRASRQVSKTKILPPQLKNKVLRKPPCFPSLCLHTFPCRQCRCCSQCKSFSPLSRTLRGKKDKQILVMAFREGFPKKWSFF